MLKKNNLIIFDIDGTLTQTTSIDTEIFYEVITDYLALNLIDTKKFNHSTDSSLLQQIYFEYLKRNPTASETQQIKEIFFNKLTAYFQTNSNLCFPISGANEIFKFINDLSNWHIGIATGCWQVSANVKLNVANIPHECIPKSYCDELYNKTEIIQASIRQCEEFYKTDNYSRIIYVGDRQWDKEATEFLNIEFISIGNNTLHTNHITDYTGESLITLTNILS